MIFDVHTHLGQLGKRTVTAEDLIASMDEANIDVSLVIANRYSTSDMGASTETVLEACAKYPRLKAVANVNFGTLDDTQIAYLSALITTKKVNGIKLGPGYEDFYPTDLKLDPIYTLCQEHQIPVIFHTGILANYRAGFLKQSHPLNIDEVATRYPKLKIIMAHMGNPWFDDCAAVLYRHNNVYVDVSAFFNEFAPILPESYAVFIEKVGIIRNYVGSYKKFIFGTDWPLYSQKEYLAAVEHLSMTEEEKELVFWKNATNVFNLQLG